jgi:hypothetical protein
MKNVVYARKDTGGSKIGKKCENSHAPRNRYIIHLDTDTVEKEKLTPRN